MQKIMGPEVRNAIITDTSLGYEDHNILTAMLYLDYGGSGQGFGGYGLDIWSEEHHKRIPHAACGLFIQRVLKVVGVDSWEKLKGKHIRVKSSWSKVHSIGNILKDEWFSPEEEFKVLEGVA
jgi:hypothetical protein